MAAPSTLARTPASPRLSSRSRRRAPSPSSSTASRASRDALTPSQSSIPIVGRRFYLVVDESPARAQPRACYAVVECAGRRTARPTCLAAPPRSSTAAALLEPDRGLRSLTLPPTAARAALSPRPAAPAPAGHSRRPRTPRPSPASVTGALACPFARARSGGFARPFDAPAMGGL
nr:atherin-like [Aegilops tauschii subsp. strangulata]